MTDRTALRIYLAIWCLSVALAAVSTWWFGLDAQVPVDMAADGTVTKSRSVAVLWLMPGMASVLYGAMGLAAWIEARRRRRKPPVVLSADAQRGLQIYGRAIRTGMAGFGLLILMLQVFAVLRTAGIVAPLGLDREGIVRLFAAMAGVLFAYTGNITPKLPWMRRPRLDTSPFYRANRAIGWIFMLGGLGYVLSALLLPFEQMIRVNGWLIVAMIGLPFLFTVHAAVTSWRRTRDAQRDGVS